MDDNKVLIDEQNLYDIADAIRRKNGETTKYLPEEMSPAIDAIPTGSGASLAGNLAVAYEGLVFPVAAGAHCIYDDMYYVAIAPIGEAEPFTPSHWQRITAGVEIQQIGTDLTTTQGAVLELADDFDTMDGNLDHVIDFLSDAQIRKPFSGVSISAPNTVADTIDKMVVYGKCVQNGTPTPELPININFVGEGGTLTFTNNENDIVVTLPNGLLGVPVLSGGNYIDPSGQRWVCDTIDKWRGVYVKRVGVFTVPSDDITFSGTNMVYRISPDAIVDTAYVGQLCNYFTFVRTVSLVTNTYGAFKVHVAPSNNATYIYMHAPEGVTDRASALAWLSTHTVIAYYPLSTYETIALTDAQKNTLNQLMSIEGTTTLSTDSVIQPNIDTMMYVSFPTVSP